METKTKKTAVEAFMDRKIEKMVHKTVQDSSIKLQVSLRLPVTAVAVLDIVSEAAGDSRTGFATELLTAAIVDVAKAANLGEPSSKKFMENVTPRVLELVPAEDRQDFVEAVEAFEEANQ